MSSATVTAYPAQFDVLYRDRSSRLAAFFRLLLVIPVAILAALVGATARSISLAVVLMLLFRGRYPRPWFEWALYVQQFTYRVNAYTYLLTDRYPSTTDAQDIVAEAQLEEGRLGRAMPLIKWLMAVPHYFVLALLGVAVFVVMVVAWLAILVTGRFPQGLHSFVVGFHRWAWRVSAYAFLLSTDRYPPFSLR